ncbi:unnamed protein product, partial [Cyprideis torosa]
MRAREELLENVNFGDDISDLLPIIHEGKSDSATMDMVLELLLMTGRELPEVMMMMVPEAWEKHATMSDAKKAFYEYNSTIMEPWDGPASIPFTDGNYLGAILDRNGLRPSRYTVTKDGFVIMSSETGVLDTPPENVKYHGRLEPGRMFLVDMNKGEIIDDEEVTNPPLDGIREEIVTDISLAIGADFNIFDINEDHCNKLRVQNPVLTTDDIHRIKHFDKPSLKAATIPMLFERKRGTNGMIDALEQMVDESEKAINHGAHLLILSDRGFNEEYAPIPALLACSYVHHAMNHRKKRSKCAIIIESAEPREVHHFATLFGYGASAVCPYLVYEVIDEMIQNGHLEIELDEAIDNFQKAVGAGVIKVMNKIGISTLHSYRAAQIFEALGLRKEFAEKYFPFTATRIEGVGILEVHEEVCRRIDKAFPSNENLSDAPLEMGGEYRWRRDGERHMFNPITVAKLQEAVRQNKPVAYEEYAKMVNEQATRLMTIRGLMEFTDFDPIPLDEVEPWTEIVKRFKTGAMSYGSISQEAHETLAVAMNRIGGYDGGTGASPMTSLKHAGLPWELGLSEAQQTLVMNDLRSRVVLECDGQLKT